MVGFSSGLMLAGIGTQVYGQYKAGQDAQAAAEYNSQVYQEQAKQIGYTKVVVNKQYDRAYADLKGETITNIASQNRNLDGSALLVMIDNLEQLEVDRINEIYNADIGQSKALSSARQSEISGNRAAGTARLQSVGTLLTQGNEWYEKFGGFGKVT